MRMMVCFYCCLWVRVSLLPASVTPADHLRRVCWEQHPLGTTGGAVPSAALGFPAALHAGVLLLTGVTLPPPSPVPWPTRFLAAGRASGCAPMTGSWLCVPSESPSSPSSLQLVLWGSGLIRILAARQELLPVTQTPLHHQGELRGWGRSLLSWGLVLWESISLSHQP